MREDVIEFTSDARMIRGNFSYFAKALAKHEAENQNLHGLKKFFFVREERQRIESFSDAFLKASIHAVGASIVNKTKPESAFKVLVDVVYN